MPQPGCSNKDRIQTDIFYSLGLFPVYADYCTSEKRPSLCHPKVMRYIKRQGTTRLRGPACVMMITDQSQVGMTDDDRFTGKSVKSLTENTIGTVVDSAHSQYYKCLL